MQTKVILDFLNDVAANNDRAWFQAHRKQYDEAKAEFDKYVQVIINRITEFDPSIAHITVRDATYRFYRDTRFSPDKSPYKRHFGAYVAAHGKKAFHGGYYIHLQPGNCMLSCGCYYLPTNILTACRNEIMANTDEWLKRVENKKFVGYFGTPGEGVFNWGNGVDSNSQGGFGLEMLKTCPSGFPRDYEHIKYLRMKDYCCWRNVDDNFFDKDDKWLDSMTDIFMTAKPMMDFVNSVIDDYE